MYGRSPAVGLCSDDLENFGVASSLLSFKRAQEAKSAAVSRAAPPFLAAAACLPDTGYLVTALMLVGLWAHPSKALRARAAFIENTC